MLTICLCERCIAKEKANGEIIKVGNYTEEAKKCYYCDSTDDTLRTCKVEP